MKNQKSLSAHWNSRVRAARAALRAQGKTEAEIEQVVAAFAAPPKKKPVRLSRANVAQANAVLSEGDVAVVVPGKAVRVYSLATYEKFRSSCAARKPWLARTDRQGAAPALPLAPVEPQA